MKALDIDGIICPFTEEVFVKAMNEVLGTELSMRDDEQSSWSYSESFSISEKDEIKVWTSEALLKYASLSKAIPKGLALVNGYEQVGLDYCFITSRASYYETRRAKRIREITKTWIKEVVGSDKEIYFINGNRKHIKAKELGVYSMYEDNPTTVKLLAESGVYVFMPKYYYNENVELNDFIIPVENWLD